MSKNKNYIDPTVEKAAKNVMDGKSSLFTVSDPDVYFVLQEEFFRDLITDLCDTIVLYIDKKSKYQDVLAEGSYEPANAMLPELNGLRQKILHIEQEINTSFETANHIAEYTFENEGIDYDEDDEEDFFPPAPRKRSSRKS